MTERERFEAWVSGPPYEKSTRCFPLRPEIEGWPGNYRDYAVQLAWEAWCAALASSALPDDCERV